MSVVCAAAITSGSWLAARTVVPCSPPPSSRRMTSRPGKGARRAGRAVAPSKGGRRCLSPALLEALGEELDPAPARLRPHPLADPGAVAEPLREPEPAVRIEDEDRMRRAFGRQAAVADVDRPVGGVAHRGVAVAMADGPESGLAIIDP